MKHISPLFFRRGFAVLSGLALAGVWGAFPGRTAAAPEAAGAPSLTPAGQPVELGTVRWLRDFEAALAESRRTGRPVLCLFQEVPGCSTCVNFGKDVAGRRDLAAVIEDYFVPVCIHNNKEGADARVLKRYSEPAWNNPVVRFFDAGGRDLIPRRDGIYQPHELAQRMADALKAAKQGPAPELDAIKSGGKPPLTECVVVAQYCFWQGERTFGGLEGVVATRAGFASGREVTAVWFDPAVTTRAAIVDAGKKAGCADLVLKEADTAGYRPAPAADQKRQLPGTEFAGLRLSPWREARVNALARTDPAAAIRLLTPGQRKEAAER